MVVWRETSATVVKWDSVFQAGGEAWTTRVGRGPSDCEKGKAQSFVQEAVAEVSLRSLRMWHIGELGTDCSAVCDDSFSLHWEVTSVLKKMGDGAVGLLRSGVEDQGERGLRATCSGIRFSIDRGAANKRASATRQANPRGERFTLVMTITNRGFQAIIVPLEVGPQIWRNLTYDNQPLCDLLRARRPDWLAGSWLVAYSVTISRKTRDPLTSISITYTPRTFPSPFPHLYLLSNSRFRHLRTTTGAAAPSRSTFEAKSPVVGGLSS